ncbi:2330_t:CDS:2 [Dentiscutata heterogama]|uniref:2330_t:CDS:1 n=1 Tax=Dentiscutata heterogama TaxID=1316150 RepID=A0ACA9KVT2_9GLOM|nr:2330_t:CDS:2 [Dentiscutata heterogama]
MRTQQNTNVSHNATLVVISLKRQGVISFSYLSGSNHKAIAVN